MLPNGQTKYFTATQAVDCLTDYRQMTNIVRGIIGATGATVAGLAGAFLLASTTSTGKEINQKFTGSDGSTVLVTGNGDQPKRQILVTYPDGVRASLTIEVYDDGDQKYFPPPKSPGEITGFPGLTPGKAIGGRAAGKTIRGISMNGTTSMVH